MKKIWNKILFALMDHLCVGLIEKYVSETHCFAIIESDKNTKFVKLYFNESL